jgi:hypothetical protein
LIGLTTPLTREYLHILERPGFDNSHGAAKGQDLTPIAVTGVSFVLTHLLVIYLFDMGLILYPVSSMETILMPRLPSLVSTRERILWTGRMALSHVPRSFAS